eukprot:GDKI01006891.1.p2 GENE.GDKI01006891.1~~GDKI01006891.1.p2  ORF type:complete len:123 (+),score=11.61 GDKI01006891.1:67-435(+)
MAQRSQPSTPPTGSFASHTRYRCTCDSTHGATQPLQEQHAQLAHYLPQPLAIPRHLKTAAVVHIHRLQFPRAPESYGGQQRVLGHLHGLSRYVGPKSHLHFHTHLVAFEIIPLAFELFQHIP